MQTKWSTCALIKIKEEISILTGGSLKLLCSIGPKNVVSKRNEFAKKKKKKKKKTTQNLNFKEENSCRFYSWRLQRTVVKKVCLIAFYLAFSFFLCRYQTSPFSPRTSASVRRKGSPSSPRRCYRWPVDTFISVKLLTGWVCHGCERHGPLLNLFRNLPRTTKISLLDFLYSELMEQFEGSGRHDDHQWKQLCSTWKFTRDYIKITLGLYRSLYLHERGSWHFLVVTPMYRMTDASWYARAFSNLEPAAIQWRRPSVI